GSTSGSGRRVRHQANPRMAPSRARTPSSRNSGPRSAEDRGDGTRAGVAPAPAGDGSATVTEPPPTDKVSGVSAVVCVTTNTDERHRATVSSSAASPVVKDDAGMKRPLPWVANADQAP